MSQAIEVVGKTEQQRLADLQGQDTARGAGRQFAFDYRKDRFDLGALIRPCESKTDS
jgi:hypothetical protein